MNETKSNTRRCDACRRDVPADEIRTLHLQTCCTVIRIPLCRECHEAHGRKAKTEA